MNKMGGALLVGGEKVGAPVLSRYLPRYPTEIPLNSHLSLGFLVAPPPFCTFFFYYPVL